MMKSDACLKKQIRTMARLYASFTIPHWFRNPVDESWPFTMMYAGYTPFRHFFDVYVADLRKNARGDMELLGELIMILAAHGSGNARFWGSAFDSPVNHDDEIETLMNELKIMSRVNGREEELFYHKVKYWCDEIGYVVYGSFGGAPHYSFSFDADASGLGFDDVPNTHTPGGCPAYITVAKSEDDKIESLTEHQLRECGSQELRLFDEAKECLDSEKFDDAHRLLCEVVKLTEYDCRSRVLWEKRGEALSILWGLPQNDDQMNRWYGAYENWKREDSMWTLRADREYEALKLGETWQAKSWNEEEIERRALRGSPKACLDMNDIYRRGGKEERMMADCWWQLRNRHLDQQYYEDPNTTWLNNDGMN